MNILDRSIDDAGLNQDSTFDIKSNENFDDSDDFHKYDDTSKQVPDKSSEGNKDDKQEKKTRAGILNV